MVVDRGELSANLARFYDFKGKSALCVGAGRGLLLDPASGAAGVVAIDRDPKSLQEFRKSRTTWGGIPIRFVPRKFETVNSRGDVVYFEFCMHQMDDPREVLEHAHSLARDIVVIDHLPGSEWVYYWAGEDVVRRSTKAMESFGVRRKRKFTAEQRFEDWKALAERLSGEGEQSRRRVLGLKGTTNLRIRMDYGLYLL
jgi:predicted RNA methylase